MAEQLDDRALDQLFREARSARTYLDRPVPEALLHDLWTLVRCGPTSMNSLPMRLVFCTSAEARERLAGLTSGSNAPKVRAAPVSAIVGMDFAFFDRLPQLFPAYDARPMFAADAALAEETAVRNSSMQGGYLILAARALGLDCGPMSGIDRAGIDAAFFAGTTIRTNFITTMGYRDPAADHGRGPRLGFDEAVRIV